MRKLTAAATAAILLLCSGGAFAADDQAAQNAERERLLNVLRSQHPTFGDVSVAGANATLHLGRKYYFLKAEEAKEVLKEWGNPPAAMDGVLGIVFPAGKTFLDETWSGVITYEPSGFISDEDEDKLDPEGLLKAVHEDEAAANEQRTKAGYPTVHLVGWAQPPAYDKARHYLIWARDLQFAGIQPDTLNYDVRVLGRRGYLSINVISDMPKLPEIRAEAAQLAATATFDSGSSYADYQPGADHKAEYGVAGLVAAGVGVAAAKKLGLLAIVAVFAKKFIVIIGAAVAGMLAKFRGLLKRKRPASSAPSTAAQPNEHPEEEETAA
jgi:uncharacterized membrane-anchored protein